jgi:hypothetical protein
MSALASKSFELRKAGVKALMATLGDEDAQAFLKLWRGTPGKDFNKWLNEQPEKSMEETLAEVFAIEEEDIANGVFAKTVGA